MSDGLFGPALPGLSLIEGMIDTAAQADLIARVEAAPLTPFRFQQWLGARETASYGLHYDFTGSGLAEAEPFPDWLAQLSNRVEHTFGLTSGTIVHALLTRYRPGATIGWHRDRSVFGEVFGISLGAAARLRFRTKVGDRFTRQSINLPPGSVYRLTGDARHVWEHSIAALQDFRWSITLRTLAGGPGSPS